MVSVSSRRFVRPLLRLLLRADVIGPGCSQWRRHISPPAPSRTSVAVTIHCAHSDEGARSAVDEIRSAGGRAEAFQADLNSVGEVRGLATGALEFLGGADVLVNN